MGRCWILCLAVYFLSIPIGISAEVKAFTYFLSGRDGAGHTIFDRFELYPNGKVLWQTASKGGLCPREGGYYQGQLGSQDRKQILQFVSAVHESEKKQATKSKKEGDETRRARHLLQVEYAEVVYSTEIKNNDSESVKFFEELAFLKAKLSPLSAIRMETTAESKKNNKLLKVSFKNIGEKPFRLVLPKNPEDVFFLKSGIKISYYKNIPKKRDMMLEKGKDFSVVLDAGDVVKGPLYFDSGTMAHHGLKNSQKELPAAIEVYLCAGESL